MQVPHSYKRMYLEKIVIYGKQNGFKNLQRVSEILQNETCSVCINCIYTLSQYQ